MEAIRLRDKLKEIFLRTKLHVDHERFKKNRNSIQQKLKNKKTNFVRNQLQKNTKKPQELSKTTNSENYLQKKLCKEMLLSHEYNFQFF